MVTVHGKEALQGQWNPDRLKTLIEQNKKPLREIAKELDVSFSVLSDWKNGKKTPRADSIIRLARYFEVSSDFLLGLTDARSIKHDIRAASELTGLSEKSLESLNQMKESDRYFLEQGHKERLVLPTLNAILGHPEFAPFMELVRQFLVYRDIPDYGGYGTSVEDEKRGLVLIGSMEYSELCRFRAMETFQRILLDVWNNYEQKQETARKAVQEIIKRFRYTEQQKEGSENGADHKEN